MNKKICEKKFCQWNCFIMMKFCTRLWSMYKSIKILRDLALKNYKNFTKFTKLIREFDSCDYMVQYV